MIDRDTASRAHLRTWLTVSGIALGVGALVLVFSGRFGENPRLVESPLIGTPVPAVELEYLAEEGSLNFTDLHGSVLVVNFWASWCIPCRAEHPSLTTAALAYEDRGVRVVGVVYQDEPAQAIAFLDELGWGGNNYYYVLDPQSRAAVEFGVFGVPETFFVDAEGIIVGKIQGAITYGALETALDQILAGQPPSL